MNNFCLFVVVALIGCIASVNCQAFSVPNCNLTYQVGYRYEIRAAMVKGASATYPVVLAAEKTASAAIVSYACLDYTCCTATKTILIGTGGVTTYAASVASVNRDSLQGVTTSDGRPFFIWGSSFNSHAFYCTDDQCTNGIMTVLGSTNRVSLALQANGNPLISAKDRLYYCNNPSCTSFTTVFVPIGLTIHDTKLTMDSNGIPWIGTINAVSANCTMIGVGVIRCNDAACSSYTWISFTGQNSIDTNCNTWNTFALSTIWNEAGQLTVFAAHPKTAEYRRFRCLDSACTTFENKLMSTVSPVRYTSVRSGVGASLWTRTNLSNGYTSIYKCAATDLDCDTRSSLYVYTNIFDQMGHPMYGHKYFEYGGRTLGVFTYCDAISSTSRARIQIYDLTNANFGI